MPTFPKDLLYERKNCYDMWDDKKIDSVFQFAKNYTSFLDHSRTERMGVQKGIEILKQNGFMDFSQLGDKKLKTGDKVFFSYREKNLVGCIIGKTPVTAGLNMVLTHIDSPRLDLKVNPLYEESCIAFLKPHYYGGIKKYQWPTIPLALHGVIILQNGKKQEIHIGDDAHEPIFMITDLLPHLAQFQMEKKANDFINAEEMNIVVGTIPVKDKKVKERVKQALLQQLFTAYGIIEEDLLGAEIEAVPAYPTRDVGFDRSLISGYGHDNRSCSFTALQALIDVEKMPERTAFFYWSDKEEIGSNGSTGAQSTFFPHVVSQILKYTGHEYDEYTLRETLHNTYGISGDVDDAYDPDYKEFVDPQNAARINHGIALTKYTGHGGKYGASDADAEFFHAVKNLFNMHNIIWQPGSIGKVDIGGGGTISKYIAELGVQIIDGGPPVLSMHAPLELLSKADLYSAYEAYKTFYEYMK